MRSLGILLAMLAALVSLCLGAKAQNAAPESPSLLAAVTPTPGDITWYYNTSPTPTPIASAYASIAGAFGAAYVYNALAVAGTPAGSGMLASGQCYFVCYGAPGAKSRHYVDFGNDVNPGPTSGSQTHNGAANDCSGPPNTCPGHVSNQAFGISVNLASLANGFFVAVDGTGNLGVLNNLYAGGAVVAGAGTGTPEPSPSPGSLVSFTGLSPGSGDVLLGSATSYVKCDYGETASSKLTCNAPLNIDGPLRSAVSTSSTPGPVPPCYEHNGTKCADTFHIVKNTNALGITTNGTCSNDTWCSLSGATVSFSGSDAPFASNKYTCALSSTASYFVLPEVNSQMATSFTIQAYNSSGSTIANNTDLGITYACLGI